ncbi:hypothetical protein CPAV1605_1515 [seawater metagenome]|uniref:Substrate binding domain of ABC-type glycine betaine transport system n=1 Tax=seawater metagenome TaxID=1561972 RepID=A0A5E8CLE6_9ZZZZ
MGKNNKKIGSLVATGVAINYLNRYIENKKIINRETNEINILLNSWASAKIIAYIYGKLLKNQGYTVNYITDTKGFEESMRDKDFIGIHPEYGWYPNYNQNHKYVEIAEHYDNAFEGLFHIGKIDDLPENIKIIIPTWEYINIEEEKQFLLNKNHKIEEVILEDNDYNNKLNNMRNKKNLKENELIWTWTGHIQDHKPSEGIKWSYMLKDNQTLLPIKIICSKKFNTTYPGLVKLLKDNTFSQKDIAEFSYIFYTKNKLTAEIAENWIPN